MAAMGVAGEPQDAEMPVPYARPRNVDEAPSGTAAGMKHRLPGAATRETERRTVE